MATAISPEHSLQDQGLKARVGVWDLIFFVAASLGDQIWALTLHLLLKCHRTLWSHSISREMKEVSIGIGRSGLGCEGGGHLVALRASA